MRLTTTPRNNPNSKASNRLRPSFSGPAIIAALRALGEAGDFDGKEFLARCPFHDDTGHRKHCYINIQHKPGVFHCFYADCEARGSFLTYIMQRTGWNLVLATTFMRKISRDVPFMLVQPKPKPKPRSEKELAPFSYRHPYCYERGITEATLQRYKVGYDAERNALTFPWFDVNAKLVAVKFRPFNPTGSRYLCEKGVEISSLLYGLHLIPKRSIIYLVEGEFDAMYLDQSFRQLHATDAFAAALGGKSLHPKAIIELLRREPKAVVLMTDNDAAGKAAASVIVAELIGKVQVKCAVYPGGTKDPNQLDLSQIAEMLTEMRTKT